MLQQQLTRADTGCDSCLHDTANNENHTTDHQSVFSSDAVLNLTTNDGTEESTSLKDTDDISLQVGYLRWCSGDAEIVRECLEGNHTTTQTGIVAEEENSHESYERQHVRSRMSVPWSIGV